MSKRIGFVSTRFAGTDGVTLESSKWADVFRQNGHRCFWFAGELDRSAGRSLLVPEAHFRCERNLWISEQVLGRKGRKPKVTQAIHELRARLKESLHRFLDRFGIEVIVAENVLSIPMHIPLGLALTETIAETQLPTICHHHDFYWERVRYSINAVSDYLRMAFPPNLPNIKHVVINSEAQEQLALRSGISSAVVPNVLDFENPPQPDLTATAAFRQAIGLQPSDRLILQPTRIIQRKGIEHAIELVKELRDPRNKLVITHEAGDEGFDYFDWLRDYAREHAVDLRLVSTRVADPWRADTGQEGRYSLWDVYPHADFITYPSIYEGFGNAFLEAIYFKKPILINRYATFVRDIEPLGFDLVVMDGYLSKKTAESVQQILCSPIRREIMVLANYAIASRYYSYSVLRSHLNAVMGHFFGHAVSPAVSRASTPPPPAMHDPEYQTVQAKSI